MTPPLLPLPSGFVWLGWLVAGLSLMVAASKRHDFAEWWQDSRLPWRVVAVITVLWVLRSFNTQPVTGISMHFMGASVVTLMFGWRLALWIMAVVTAFHAFMGMVWLNWPWDYLATGVVPVLVTYAGWRLSRVVLKAHPMVFIMANGFVLGWLGALLSMGIKLCVGQWLGDQQAEMYLLMSVLMGFGEAFFTGGALAIMVAYRPEWCRLYSDAFYLQKHNML